MPATAAPPVSVETLVALWHGDDDCDGYWHPELVAAACDLIQPANVTTIRNHFYPCKPGAELPDGAAHMIVAGYWTWRRRQP